MEIITQAAFGISKFIHPDYVSATPRTDYFKIDFFDGSFIDRDFYYRSKKITQTFN